MKLRAKAAPSRSLLFLKKWKQLDLKEATHPTPAFIHTWAPFRQYSFFFLLLFGTSVQLFKAQNLLVTRVLHQSTQRDNDKAYVEPTEQWTQQGDPQGNRLWAGRGALEKFSLQDVFHFILQPRKNAGDSETKQSRTPLQILPVLLGATKTSFCISKRPLSL